MKIKKAKSIWFVLLLTLMVMGLVIACSGGGGSDGGGGAPHTVSSNDIDDDGDGYTENEGDCDDTVAESYPGAMELCGDGVDQDCDGSDVDCSSVPDTPANVQASDLSEGLTNVEVSWGASNGATYYNVYRAIFEEDGEYILVGENITGTTYTFEQNWKDDVEDIIGLNPGLAYEEGNANDVDKTAFINSLNTYRDNALPTLFGFKAPAYFKVAACDETGCSPMSAADLGQANYIHNQEESEVAMKFIPIWGYAVLLSLADVPSQAQGLSWCGIDLCGAGGGIAMARAGLSGDGNFSINVDVVYDGYTEALVGVDNAYAVMNGSLGGQMNVGPAYQGHYWFTGEFNIVTSGAEITLGMYAEIGGRDENDAPIHDGYANITYQGETYQFSLPIQAADNISGHDGKPIEPNYPARTDIGQWRPSNTVGDPVPLADGPQEGECPHNWTTYTVQTCQE